MSTTSETDLWLEFVSESRGLCGLCGNSGIVDTIARVKSPTGVACGVARYCICPNGRSLLEFHGGEQLMVDES